MLYDLRDFGLMLIEHEDAFTPQDGRPRHLENVPLDFSGGWQAALETLTDDVLAAELDDVLGSRRVRALAERRDEILASAGSR
jgi:hypothetical protein